MLPQRHHCIICVCCGMLASATVAEAKSKNRRTKVEVVTPEQSAATQKDDDLSRGGTRRGILEYSLGGVTAAVSTTLVVFGSVQLYRGQQLQTFCQQPATFNSPECMSVLGNPVTNARISGGLSLGFAIPLAVASGFLFRRAVRIHRDYRKQVALTPYFGRGFAGGSLAIRF